MGNTDLGLGVELAKQPGLVWSHLMINGYYCDIDNSQAMVDTDLVNDIPLVLRILSKPLHDANSLTIHQLHLVPILYWLVSAGSVPSNH